MSPQCALERAARAAIAARQRLAQQPNARTRALAERAFAAVLAQLDQRCTRLIAQVGLTAQGADARQACAIAVHRALDLYAPERASFSTLVHWQLRAELQALRLISDGAARARRRGRAVALVSLDELVAGDLLCAADALVDPDAERAAVGRASAWLARRCLDRLLETRRGAISPRDAALVRRYLFASFDDARQDEDSAQVPPSADRQRRIVTQILRDLAAAQGTP